MKSSKGDVRTQPSSSEAQHVLKQISGNYRELGKPASQHRWPRCKLVPHLRSSSAFSSTCPAVRLAAASCSHFQRNVGDKKVTDLSEAWKRKGEKGVLSSCLREGAETQRRETRVAGLHVSSFYPSARRFLLSQT